MAVSLSAVSVVAAGSGQSRAGQGRKIRKYDLHSVDRLEELRHNMNEIVEILCQGSWQGAAGQPRATCRGQGRDFSPSVVSGRAGAGGRDTATATHPPLLLSASWDSPAGAVAQGGAALAVGRRRGAGLGTEGEAGLWRNWTFAVRARLKSWKWS